MSSLPPDHLVQYIGGEFTETGREFLNHFKELGQLKPNHHVLDVGSGVGRMAMPLTNYLSKDGAYHGFDLSKEGIDWSNAEIASKYDTFTFTHVDLFNPLYNPSGTLQASSFAFPYEDNSFDFVFLTSIFTHLLEQELEHYTAEISRVLKKGGRCLMTFFIVNEESAQLIHAGQSSQPFFHANGISLVVLPDAPNAAVAYPEDWVSALLTRHGLKQESIHYGSWCGRTTFTSYQDIIIVEKS
ncbi:methyltransferase [Bacillus sp. JCM 19046]|uniref:SAM-dependent methyltransferase n=2 Tax=Shouchella xiaoxiensis TaxID=766895 RepID=A0ABS2SPG6_9BACI|nr:SAM-dependent methyltransferase [Shouchella xiaoxiensis]GAF13255.1 methyltransferase [Bacillus sp. JCM 19045]GAF17061.1 methyltransferase [Bacillus sp. JCM 19046]